MASFTGLRIKQRTKTTTVGNSTTGLKLNPASSCSPKPVEAADRGERTLQSRYPPLAATKGTSMDLIVMPTLSYSSVSVKVDNRSSEEDIGLHRSPT